MTKESAKKLRIQLLIDRVGDEIESAKKAGADVSTALADLKNAKIFLKKNKIFRANNKALKARQQCREAKRGYRVKTLISNAKYFMNHAKVRGADISAAEKYLDKAIDAYKKNMWGEAAKLVRIVKREVKEAKSCIRAKKMIESASFRLKRAEKMGIEIVEAKELLEQGKKHFEKKEYSEVGEAVRRAKTAADEAVKHKEADNQILDVEREIEYIKKLRIDVEEVDSLLEKARSSLEKKNYWEVRKTTRKIQKWIKETMEQESRKKVIGKIKDVMEKGMKDGVDKLEADKFLQDIEKMLKKGVVIPLKAVDDNKKRLEEDMLKIKGTISNIEEKGVELKDAQITLKNVKKSLDENNLEAATEQLDETKKLISKAENKLLIDKAKIDVWALVAVLDTAQARGIETDEERQLLALVEKELNNKNIGEAIGLIDRARIATKNKIQDAVKEREPKISSNFLSYGIEDDKWNKCVFELSNEGDWAVKNVEVNFAGDVEVKEIQSIPMLDAGEKKTIEVGIKPKRKGEIPLNIALTYQKIFDETKYKLDDLKRVDVKDMGTYLIEDVFLIHMNGCLLAHETRKYHEEIDADIFSAMLTAVQDFVKDSFKDKNAVGLRKMSFGLSTIFIERGRYSFLVAVVVGTEPRLLPLHMVEILREVEEKYGNILKDWKGWLEDVKGIDEIIKKIIFVSDDVKATAEKIGPSVVSSVHSLMEKADQEGKDVAGTKELLQHADEMIEKQDFESVWGYVEKARRSLLGLETVERIKEKVPVSRPLVEEVDKRVVDRKLKEYLVIIDKVVEKVNEEKEKLGLSLEWPVKNIVIKVENEQVEEAVSSLKNSIVERTKAKGIEIVPENRTWRGKKLEVIPNTKAIRSAYKRWAGRIELLLKHQSTWKVKEGIESGKYTLWIENQSVEIKPYMVSFKESLPQNITELKFEGGTIYIDTEITDEIMAEGFATEIIKEIQELRSDKALKKKKIFKIMISTSVPLNNLLEDWKDFIISETKTEIEIIPKEEYEEYQIEIEAIV